MAFLKLLVISVMYAVQLCLCESSTKEFTTWESFKSDILSTEYSLVDFYATWCPHCMKLAPEFEKAAEIIEAGHLNAKVQLAKIECDGVGKKVCETNSIQGYPTLKVYHKGKAIDEYFGERKADAIVKYMKAVATTGKAQFVGKHINTHQKICTAKSYRKYVSHKS